MPTLPYTFCPLLLFSLFNVGKHFICSTKTFSSYNFKNVFKNWVDIEIPRDIHQRGFLCFFPPSALCLSMSLASSEEIHGRNWQVEKWSCSEEALLHFLWVNNKKEFNAKDFVICDATSRCHFWYSTLIKAKKNLLDTVDIHWEKRFLGRSWLSTKNEKNDRIFLFL